MYVCDARRATWPLANFESKHEFGYANFCVRISYTDSIWTVFYLKFWNSISKKGEDETDDWIEEESVDRDISILYRHKASKCRNVVRHFVNHIMSYHFMS